MTQEQDDEQVKLLAAVIMAEQRLPGGYQIALGDHLDKAIAAVEQLYERYQLPMRDQLIAELAAWRGHIHDGIRLMSGGYQLLQQLMRLAEDSDWWKQHQGSRALAAAHSGERVGHAVEPDSV